jgi:hypothetical protein
MIELISSRLHTLKPTFGDKGSCTYASSFSEIVDINKEVHQSHVDINKEVHQSHVDISKEEGEISKLPQAMEDTQMDNLQQSIESHEKNILNMPKAMEVFSITHMENFHFVEPHKEDNQAPRSPFHS